MRGVPDHFWDFMEDGDFPRFCEQERKMMRPGIDDQPMDWQPISLAPAEEVVLTKIDDEHGERNVQTLIRQGSLWFYPDKSMYVYYSPTHWKRM